MCVCLPESISKPEIFDNPEWGGSCDLPGGPGQMSSEFERFCGNTVRKGKITKPCSPQATPSPHWGVISCPSQSASRGQCPSVSHKHLPRLPPTPHPVCMLSKDWVSQKVRVEFSLIWDGGSERTFWPTQSVLSCLR